MEFSKVRRLIGFIMNAVFPKSYWEVQTDDTPLYFLHIAKTAGTR
jgi:hypothetical protein